MILLISIIISTLISIIFMILFKRIKRIIYVTVSAGTTDFYSTEFKSFKDINIRTSNKIYSSSDDKYLFARINGSSMKKLQGELFHDDLAIVDKSIKISSLKKHDAIALKYKHKNEDEYSYKVRSYLDFTDNILTSETYSDGKLKISRHDIGTFEYIGKVTLKYSDFFKDNDII